MNKQMLVILPYEQATAHLRGCENYMRLATDDRTNLLYAALFAHMALHAILVVFRFEEDGMMIMSKEEKTPLLKEGVRTKSFEALLKGVQIGDDEKKGVLLVNGIRDRLQHPIPGPSGYIIDDLVLGIRAAVKVGWDILERSRTKRNAGVLAHDEALALSDAILAQCLGWDSNRISLD